MVIDRIEVELEECLSSDCSTVRSISEFSLQPRGECPSDFANWFPSFLIDDLNLLQEVEPPARIVGEVQEPPGVFRRPPWQNDLQVRLPIDATLVGGFKMLTYSNLEDRNPEHVPEVQYGLLFETTCEGLWFKVEHLLELATGLIPYLEGVPISETTQDHEVGPVSMSEGDLLATRIGFALDGNAAFGFGIHDDFRRVPTAQHPQQNNAACYYDFFAADTAEFLREKTVQRWPVHVGVCP